MINLKRLFLYKIAPAIPVIQLILSAISAKYHFNFFDAGNTIGFSLMTNIVYVTLFFFATRHKYCFIPQACTLGLIAMNFISWIGKPIGYHQYNLLYDVSITMICAFIIFIIWTNKKQQDKEYQTIKKAPR